MKVCYLQKFAVSNLWDLSHLGLFSASCYRPLLLCREAKWGQEDSDHMVSASSCLILPLSLSELSQPLLSLLVLATYSLASFDPGPLRLRSHDLCLSAERKRPRGRVEKRPRKYPICFFLASLSHFNLFLASSWPLALFLLLCLIWPSSSSRDLVIWVIWVSSWPLPLSLSDWLREAMWKTHFLCTTLKSDEAMRMPRSGQEDAKKKFTNVSLFDSKSTSEFKAVHGNAQWNINF